MDIDNFEIPELNKKKDDMMSTAPDLSLGRHISFGPINSKKENSKTSSSKVLGNRMEEEKISSIMGLGMSKKNGSIAGFLQHSLKCLPQSRILELNGQKASLFAAKSSDGPSNQRNPPKPIKTILEEERAIEDMDLEEFDDFDDMELDDLPEPSLK